MQEGYGTCRVCVCVCYHSSANIARFYKGTLYVGVYLTQFLTRGFSINPSVQKLWHEKANMQMSMYLLRPVLGGFEYRTYISKYLKAEH